MSVEGPHKDNMTSVCMRVSKNKEASFFILVEKHA